MKVKRIILCISTVGIVLILLVSVGTVLGQSPDDGPANPGTETVETSSPEGEEPYEQERVEEPANTEFILAQPPYTMNYQGYLTDSSGSPLNGTYEMTFRLYDDLSLGSLEWGPETHANVPVNNGIFQVALGVLVPLNPNDFDEALFLAVAVGGTDVTPRQPLRSVPYAFGLVPGAEVQGDPSAVLLRPFGRKQRLGCK